MSDGWAKVRTPAYRGHLEELALVIPGAERIKHVRTAHYAAFRVTGDGIDLLARFGADWAAQEYERQVAELWAGIGAPVVQMTGHHRVGRELSLATLPWLEHHPGPVETVVWANAVEAIQRAPRTAWMRTFTNHEKSLRRTQALPAEEGVPLAEAYEAAYRSLIRVASRWAWVHGDLHANNIIRHVDGTISIFDLDTACWAPAVWDITHLAYRLGTDGNTGYDPDELCIRLGFSVAEFRAAAELRSVAKQIAEAAGRHPA